jgi:nitrate/nitrite-specific signal transduction histidine kinase
MGFHIMRYRARMLDGTLDIRPTRKGGMTVSCHF